MKNYRFDPGTKEETATSPAETGTEGGAATAETQADEGAE